MAYQERLTSAMGIAGSSSAGLLEFAWSGGDTKRLHLGRASQLGLESALLARHGVRGPATVLEGLVSNREVTPSAEGNTSLPGATTRVRLGTTVLIVPYRNAVVTAKMISSLDALSGGRFVFGIGAGWVAAESAALGVPFTERGAMTDEYLVAMQELWTKREPSFAGKYTQWSGLVFEPKPAQKPQQQSGMCSCCGKMAMGGMMQQHHGMEPPKQQ